MSQAQLDRELGWTGTLTFLVLALLAVIVTILFSALRPPTVEEVEHDIWKDWAKATVDSQGEDIAGLLRLGRREACQQLLFDFGRTVNEHGEDFVVRTDVRLLRIRDQNGNVFAQWQPEQQGDGLTQGWMALAIPLADIGEEPIGTLEVEYKFNESTLGSLPNIRRLAELHTAARWLVGILAVVMLAAAIANLQRLRERAARLQSQQVTLDLARQMCHELRNGLWAFSLEGKNLRQLFALVEDYFEKEPHALKEAGARIGLSDRDLERLRRQIKKHLSELHLDPETDLLAANEMAKDSHQQIENFSRYINLTVEELDRNLLGTSTLWEPTHIRVREGWKEACDLLALRMQSAGVVSEPEFKTEEDYLFADRRALVHIFVNLLKNAIEAMRHLSERRVVRMVVERLDNSVVCKIHNRGEPIPTSVLPYIFQRGFSTKAGAGRGLGLALVRDSMARMNGEIAVESGDAGTTFTLRWPYRPARGTDTSVRPATANSEDVRELPAPSS